MSIQLQGNAESTFTNNVTINRTSGDQHCLVASHGDNDNQAWIAGNGYIFTRNGLAVGGTGEGQGIGNAVIAYDGSASFGSNAFRIFENGSIGINRTDPSNTMIACDLNGTNTTRINADGSAMFKGDLQVSQTAGTERTIQVGTIATPGKVSIRSNGNAYFSGTVTQGNTLLNLDTGGTLDVKERIQNTQAILYRLKAALIQPDADVNTLRQRLLEALDILTSDGDES